MPAMTMVQALNSASLNRIPGEGRGPPGNSTGAPGWVPAFAGNGMPVGGRLSDAGDDDGSGAQLGLPEPHPRRRPGSTGQQYGGFWVGPGLRLACAGNANVKKL